MKAFSAYLICVGLVFNLIGGSVYLGANLIAGVSAQELAEKFSNSYRVQKLVPYSILNRLMILSSAASAEEPTPPRNKTSRPNPFVSAANALKSYPYQMYDQGGKPLGMKTGDFLPLSLVPVVRVTNSEQLLSAILGAHAGTIISVAAGSYPINARSIAITTPGTPTSPIYVRADRLGEATLRLNSLEGFHVQAPFWVFENLQIEGVCNDDSYCEHAFHVTGKGSSFVLRNSILRDFNAPLKVNLGIAGNERHFPDNGLVEYNSIANTRVRNTGNPVTMLNINAANNWVVRGNFIADFSKGASDRISYAAFMKSNSRNGLFERNMVLCEHNLPADKGVRVGLSFGGGGSGKKFCREQDCSTEHSNGIIRNNAILNCSRDVGIYLNRSANTHIYNNLLFNNLGIDVRFETSSATIINNMISGRIKSRNGGQFRERNNVVDEQCFGEGVVECSFTNLYADPGIADLRLKQIENSIWGKAFPLDKVQDDLCGNLRVMPSDIGPLHYAAGLDCLKP